MKHLLLISIFLFHFQLSAARMKMIPVTYIIALIFCLYGKAASEPHDLYQQMQKLNASCFPLDSCAAFNDSKSDHLWNQRKCECGPHCVRFGTCCADSAHALEKNLFDVPESEYCRKVKYFPTPVIMVSECDSNWEWPSSIVEKCEKDKYSSKDRLFTNIPLTNVKTLTTYKNYFCAVCNYGGKDFQYWSVSLNASDHQQWKKILKRYRNRYVLENIQYDNHKKNWVFLDKSNGKRLRTKVSIVLPSYLSKMVKPCYANLIQTCKSSRSRSLIKQYCQAYYSPIEIKSRGRTFVYKNIYCAMCNNVNTSSVKASSCMNDTLMKTEKTMLFPYYIDINLRKGHEFGMTEVPEPYCGVNAIYDPLENKCRKLQCVPGIGEVLIDGECVLMDIDPR